RPLLDAEQAPLRRRPEAVRPGQPERGLLGRGPSVRVDRGDRQARRRGRRRGRVGVHPQFLLTQNGRPAARRPPSRAFNRRRSPVRASSAVRPAPSAGLTTPLPFFPPAPVPNGIVSVSCVQGFLPGTFESPSAAPEDQARQVLRNLKVILEQAGSGLSHVLKI